MNIEFHIEHASKAIHNAKIVGRTSKKSNVHPEHIRELRRSCKML